MKTKKFSEGGTQELAKEQNAYVYFRNLVYEVEGTTFSLHQ